MTQTLTNFLAEFLSSATTSHAKFYPHGPFISITLAQTILESDWGQHTAGANNYWGIKATATQISRGQFRALTTHETIHNLYQSMTQYFATYPTLLDGFNAHATLLTTSHYQRCIDAHTPDEYAHALWLCHYATGIPGHPYDQALIDLMRSYNLYQYDRPPTELTT